jgi:hypothetical protein
MVDPLRRRLELAHSSSVPMGLREREAVEQVPLSGNDVELPFKEARPRRRRRTLLGAVIISGLFAFALTASALGEADTSLGDLQVARVGGGPRRASALTRRHHRPGRFRAELVPYATKGSWLRFHQAPWDLRLCSLATR